MDGAGRVDSVRKAQAISNGPAIDEDRHMLAQGGLVIEHVAPRLGVLGENVVQDFTHRPPRTFGVRAEDVALDVGLEREPWALLALRSSGPSAFEVGPPSCPSRRRATRGLPLTSKDGWKSSCPTMRAENFSQTGVCAGCSALSVPLPSWLAIPPRDCSLSQPLSEHRACSGGSDRGRHWLLSGPLRRHISCAVVWRTETPPEEP